MRRSARPPVARVSRQLATSEQTEITGEGPESVSTVASAMPGLEYFATGYWAAIASACGP
jgi:hypothetical protein